MKVLEVQQRYIKLKNGPKYTDIPLYTLRELIWSGRLPFIKFGKAIYLDRLDLDEFMLKNKRREKN